MKPKKYKEILKKVKENNPEWNEELMQEAVNFYYSRVRKALSNLEDTNVFLPKLGTFRIRKQKMDKMISDKERLVEKLNPHEFNKYDRYRRHKDQLDKLNIVKEKFNELDKQRSAFRSEETKEDETDLGDTSGDS